VSTSREDVRRRGAGAGGMKEQWRRCPVCDYAGIFVDRDGNVTPCTRCSFAAWCDRNPIETRARLLGRREPNGRGGA
jgi:hypothetical protein